MTNGQPPNDDGIAWESSPDTRRRRLIPILSPKHLAPVTAIIIGPEMEGVMTHFVVNRTQPCLRDKGVCLGCSYGIVRRGKGYWASVNPARVGGASGRKGVECGG